MDLTGRSHCSNSNPLATEPSARKGAVVPQADTLQKPEHMGDPTPPESISAGNPKRRRRSGLKGFGRRMSFYILAAWAAITMNFFIPRLMPGDPADAIIDQFRLVSGGREMPSEAVESIRILFGDPNANVLEQYIDYLGRLAQFDLGISVSRFPVPVSELILSGLPWTLMLAGAGLVIAFAIGITMGVFAGWKPGSAFDSAATPIAMFTVSIPYFWIALLAVWVLGFGLGLFPISGGYDPNVPFGSFDFYLSVLYHGVLPLTTIVFSSFGGWLMGMRNMTVTTIGEDYVQLARAKGIRPLRIVATYAARNAILPSFTSFALSLGGIIGGALMTEMVFAYPGIGFLLFDAIEKRDYPVMQGVFLLVSLATLAANFLADSLYVLLDPRTRETR